MPFSRTYLRSRFPSIFIAFCIGGFILFLSCSKEEFNTDPLFKLEFNRDTILFDTIFTTIGTTTRVLTVHNPGDRKVLINSVRLGRGKESPYRINIDGEALTESKDLELASKDSLYIFIKVTIDPNNLDNPLIQTDSIVFDINGHFQDVKLVAWGQDAVFFADDTLTGNVEFAEQKPYVVYGNLVVDSLASLTVKAGSRMYFHQNSGLLIRNGGKINVEGTLDAPVLFRGDRLDKDYKDVPGQWLGIEIAGESNGNTFTYACITNARYGIVADSSGNTAIPHIILYNSTIHNMVNYGLLSTHNNILALNCQLTNCGAWAVAIEGGGKCEFRHCTLGNFQGLSGFHYPALLLSNYIYHDDGSKTKLALESAYFGNCIIAGSSQEDEIQLDSIAGAGLSFTFDHCLVQTGEYSSHQASFPGCIINKDPKFKDAFGGDFSLDTLSVCKDAGLPLIISQSPKDITTDIKGVSRSMDAGPDLGCFERRED